MLNLKNHSFQMIVIFLTLIASVGFYTLLERKILSLSQMRLGPNKTILTGLFQPILDGLKLFKKLNSKNLKFVKIFYVVSPSLMLIISCALYTCHPYKFWLYKSLTILWVLVLVGVLSFFILILSWSSSNMYSMIGGLRSICQMISLEINLVFLMSFYFIIFSKNNFMKDYCTFFMSFLLVIFFIVFMMETQRSPFDLSESESETVSGFNIEYSGLFFIFIFLSEYLNILFFSGLISSLFMANMVVIIWMLTMSMSLLCRTCFPRIRYDLLMEFNWIKFCPVIISSSVFMMVWKFL